MIIALTCGALRVNAAAAERSFSPIVAKHHSVSIRIDCEGERLLSKAQSFFSSHPSFCTQGYTCSRPSPNNLTGVRKRYMMCSRTEGAKSLRCVSASYQQLIIQSQAPGEN